MARPSGPICSTPKGQMSIHNLHPMHKSWSIVTGLSLFCRWIAPVGQISMQGGASQCLHWIGTANSSACSTVTIRWGFGDSATASSSTFDFECTRAQANSQLLQAKHFSIFITMTLSTFFLRNN
jgi:hypothetical protein